MKKIVTLAIAGALVASLSACEVDSDHDYRDRDRSSVTVYQGKKHRSNYSRPKVNNYRPAPKPAPAPKFGGRR